MSGSTEQATERTLLRALATIRVSQFVLYLPAFLMEPPTVYRYPTVVNGLYVAVATWVAAMLVATLRRAKYGPYLAVADVAVVATAVWAVDVLSSSGAAFGWSNWAVAPMVGVAMMVAAFRSRAHMMVSIGVLTAAYAIGAWPNLGGSADVVALASNVVSVIVFAFVSRLVTGWLRAASVRADRLAMETLTARQEEAAIAARFEERTRQYRALHDTVLSTLSLIARGGIDHRTSEVQQRCANEADFLRGLISASVDTIPTTLGTALAKVGHEPAAFGLRVHQQFDNLPENIPEPIMLTLMSAAREGLNNVVKHAQVSEAWLSATANDAGVITLTIADSGVGFDPATVTAGMGLSQSLRGRIGEIGGRVSIDSAHGEGTTVEVVWSP